MIVFNENLENRILYSHNNSIIEFYSDSTALPLKAEITGLGFTATIYPSQDKLFWFNFKEYINALINVNNYIDKQTLTNAVTTNPYLYILNSTITIFLNNDTNQATSLIRYFIAGAKNKRSKIFELATDNFILSPKINLNTYYLKKWVGFPFDYSFYIGGSVLDSNITNTTTNEQSNINLILNKFNRIKNVNNLLIGKNNLNIDEYNINLQIENIQPCSNENVYLKWFYNGAFYYWLFENYQEITTSENLKTINQDFYNLNKSFGATSEVGKNVNSIINCNQDIVNELDAELLMTIFVSPKVFMYTGATNTDLNYVFNPFDFLEVRISNKSLITKNWKGQPVKIDLQLIVPDIDTLKI